MAVAEHRPGLAEQARRGDEQQRRGIDSGCEAAEIKRAANVAESVGEHQPGEGQGDAGDPPRAAKRRHRQFEVQRSLVFPSFSGIRNRAFDRGRVGKKVHPADRTTRRENEEKQIHS